ncbi:hypothetical protein Tco_0986839 [Tanacetum coccineum]
MNVSAQPQERVQLFDANSSSFYLGSEVSSVQKEKTQVKKKTLVKRKKSSQRIAVILNGGSTSEIRSCQRYKASISRREDCVYKTSITHNALDFKNGSILLV